MLQGRSWTLIWRANTGSGLIAFALTVALVQQSVRGAIETNVKTGGTLFEIDHVRAFLPARCNSLSTPP